MFWLVAIALTLITAAAILWPFWRAPVQSRPAAAYDLRVYRDQLAEVDRDLARKIISSAEADRLRAEIGRKVLDADRALQKAGAGPAAPGAHKVAAILLLVLAIGGAWGVYRQIGAPGLPDMGLQSRIAAAEARYAARPDQAEAEARFAAHPRPRPPADPDAQRLMERLHAVLAENPDDQQGLAMLAEYEPSMGNFAAGARAHARLNTLKGDSATASDHAYLATLMTEAAGRLITPQAEAEIARALALDPTNEEARYLAGLLQVQNGRADRAFPVWAALLEESTPASPWHQMIRPVIGDLAWLAGQPNYMPPGPVAAPALPGPDAAAMEAAAAMDPEDRRAFIQAMVDQLSHRLAIEGGTPGEWARLISSLAVLGDAAQARAVHTEAQEVFAQNPDGLAMIDAAARQAGIIQ
ncbi:MAG: c-type cytochrome biogenesis protein CcmI [Paracoccus sp. (in: a-proteobacteria)]|nr:c-type cytochrome biogenesis protein CcmI [Paracoccus sp. (in: a-proteobacteria)]